MRGLKYARGAFLASSGTLIGALLITNFAGHDWVVVAVSLIGLLSAVVFLFSAVVLILDRSAKRKAF